MALISKPKSSNNNSMRKIWAAPYVVAYNSASALESATVACVLGHVFKQCPPSVISHPLLLGHVALLPAQKESVKVSNGVGINCLTFPYVAKRPPKIPPDPFHDAPFYD